MRRRELEEYREGSTRWSGVRGPDRNSRLEVCLLRAKVSSGVVGTGES